MNLLSVVVGIAVVFIMMKGFEFNPYQAAAGGFIVFLIFSFLSRKPKNPVIQEGVQIVVPSERIGPHVGSEESPFGRVRSVSDDQ
jgi:hypothetical protein